MNNTLPLTRLAFSSIWEGECLIYKPGVRLAGLYPRVGIAGVVMGAHRFVYEQFNGSIPEGWHVHHVCENKRCLNPRHLRTLSPHAHVLEHGFKGMTAACTRIAQIRRRKVRCKRGHLLDDENVYWHRGLRSCRKCRAQWRRDRVETDPAFRESERLRVARSRARRVRAIALGAA